MAKEVKNDAQLELSSFNKTVPVSNEDKDAMIKTLKGELEEELVVTSSLTHIVAEKTAEIEHLQKKVSEQEARIYNLEDQIEEWTTQAESCDKLLEQKDCEIEMLKKSLKIEKQQRRDLEDMTMEVGKENILEKETLEKKIASLQAEVARLAKELEKKAAEVNSGADEKGNAKEPPATDAEKPDKISSKNEDVDVKKVEKPKIEKEEYHADMEVVMNDLFVLIKQNEELKEEIDRLKTEQSNMTESNRNVVMELETILVERSAEVQHQKHEIRRLSSVVEASDGSKVAESDLDKYNQVKRIREELQFRIDDLESINSELKSRLDDHEATKDSVTKQYNKMKRKLQLERDQNAELNRQILEVSNLYDTYYTKCEELEKGRVKGIDSPLGERHDRPMDEKSGDAAEAESSAMADASAVANKPRDSVQEKSDRAEAENGLSRQGSEESKKSTSGEDVTSIQENSRKKMSNKRKRKLKKQLSSKSSDEDETQEKSDSVLLSIVYVTRLFALLSVTFFVVTALRVYYDLSFGQISSTVFATYVFLYNLWRALTNERQSESDNKQSKQITRKLRKAMEDLILRLDETNFEQFREVYESYIVQSFDEPGTKPSRNLEEENLFLNSSKDVLAKELVKYKEMNNSVHSDYNKIKREIDILRVKRVEEDEIKQKVIQSLKDDIKLKEMQLSAKLEPIDNEESPIGLMPGSLLKLLLFALLEGLLLMSASNSFILIPASLLSVVFLVLVYKTDLRLSYISNENRGFQRTVKDLLRKVNECKEEGKQTSDEVRELEAVVDKDYEIISKQRHAIERLERQLQRAINKYREKKRTLGRFVWLQEQKISEFPGLDTSGAGEQLTVDELINNNQSLIDSNHQSVVNQEAKSTWGRFGIKALLVVAIISGAFIVWRNFDSTVNAWRNYGGYSFLNNLDPFYFSGTAAVLLVAAVLLKRQFRKREIIQKADAKTQLRELREDQRILVEQVEMLRELLSNEREFVAKLEKQVEVLKEVPEIRVPKDEVNAVIDRLIEVSKQRDELEVTASSARDKYDHIKKTLEDILSREKYLSVEVSSLRSQKRELQNDLMREQLKHIDTFEEMRRLKDISEKEVDDSQNYDVEWDFAIEDFIDKTVIEDAAMLPESALVLESDGVLESLEQAGSHAQKNRKKRNSRKKQKEKEESKIEGVDGEIQPSQNGKNILDDADEMQRQTLKTSGSEEALADEIENGKELVSNAEEWTENVEQAVESMAHSAMINDGDDSQNPKRANSDIGVQGDDSGEVLDNDDSLLKKIERQKRLLHAKDSELEQLRGLLDMTNLNVSRENSDSGTERDYDKKFELDVTKMREFEKEIRKLAAEIVGLKDLLDNSEASLKGGIEDMANPAEDFVSYLTEYVLLFRYRISADKAAMIAKVNAMEEEVEHAQHKIEKLTSDILKEKEARNNVITEYENEYERLEIRLSEAYENIRKRLMEERALRGEIMKQYENEIEDIQAKTTKILKDLQEQLKQERKEKEEAKSQTEGMGKKIKDLEAELKSIEEIEKSNQVYLDLQDLLIEKSEGKRGKTQQSHIVKLKKLAEEEADKRTRVLKERLDKAMRSIDDCKSKLNEKEANIHRLEKQERAFKTKIDIKDQRMKDLENELRNPGTGVEDVTAWTTLRKSKDGLIYNLATKNGTSEWENPSSIGFMQVTRSSAGFGNVSDILDEKPMPCSTENLEDSWYQLDFGQDKTVIPESYSLRHGWLSKDGCIRSWVLEGSVDGNQWHLLRKHSMDTSINDRFKTGSWQLSENHLPFRYLRIRMTGPNSSNTNELYIGGIEVFGRMIHSS